MSEAVKPAASNHLRVLRGRADEAAEAYLVPRQNHRATNRRVRSHAIMPTTLKISDRFALIGPSPKNMIKSLPPIQTIHKSIDLNSQSGVARGDTAGLDSQSRFLLVSPIHVTCDSTWPRSPAMFRFGRSARCDMPPSL